MLSKRLETKQTLAAEASRLLSGVGDEPTEEEFKAYRRWSDSKGLGVATSMEVYENAVLISRSRRTGNA